MKKIKQDSIYIITLGMFVLGIVLGGIIPEFFAKISFIGTVYVNMLKLIVIPLLMCEIAVSVYSSVGETSKTAVKTVLLFIVMFVISFLLTAILVSVIKPGVGLDITGEWDGELAQTTLSGFFIAVFSPNLFQSMLNNDILPCIIFAFVFGIAAAKVKAGKVMAVFSEGRKIFARILSYIMWLTPLGVFALIGNTVAQYGGEILGTCAIYILTAYLGCALVAVVVMILPVWIFAGISPVTYIKNVYRIWLMTMSTCSSAATLPNTIKVCNEKFNVPEKITGLVVPLGCTIHMCGGAVSFCLLGLFSLQMLGMELTFGLFMYMLLVATLMNMAAPGIPGGGIVLGATYLSILGVPLSFIGVYSGIYRLLDMAYTTMNVTGDITANILIARSEQK